MKYVTFRIVAITTLLHLSVQSFQQSFIISTDLRSHQAQPCNHHRHPHHHDDRSPIRSNGIIALEAHIENNDIFSDSLSYESSSTQFAIDPHSEEAKSLVMGHLGLSLLQYEKLVQLADLVVSWNDRINVVSRRDCTAQVVFGRHILPSLALLVLLQQERQGDTLVASPSVRNIIDVGTGGGFPGIPLAIALPNVNFVLVDSVGKKLVVVQELTQAMDLNNVLLHHGRAEDMADDVLIGQKHRKAYDICVGRSVTSIPRFCFWIQDLLRERDGKLLYIIGGELEDCVVQNSLADLAIDDLLHQSGASDKRILVFSQPQVKAIAAASGEVKLFRGSTKAIAGPNPSKRVKAKGAWTKREKGSAPKQRGHENFKRYGY